MTTNDAKSDSAPKADPELAIPAIPVGTQVVLRRDVEERKAGAVGEVAEAAPTPGHRYKVRFSDGSMLLVKRKHLRTRKAFSKDSVELSRGVEEYERHLILRATLGSRAYGLATEDSDRDERGIFLPPAEWDWSLSKVPDQVEFKADGNDFCWWEIEKFLRLALRANPTILELLFVGDEHRSVTTDLGRELVAMRSAFVTKQVYQTYSGYALSQFKKLKKAGKKWSRKHAMHLIRLLHAGIHAVKTGEVLVTVHEQREELLAIKGGKRTFEEVHALALELDGEFQIAFETTALPDAPDSAPVNEFLIRARRKAAVDTRG